MQFDSKIFTEQIIFHPEREKCDIVKERERERECDIEGSE